jgi:hypothetical protein
MPSVMACAVDTEKDSVALDVAVDDSNVFITSSDDSVGASQTSVVIVGTPVTNIAAVVAHRSVTGEHIELYHALL